MDGGDFVTPTTLHQRLVDIGNMSIAVNTLYPSSANGGITATITHRGGVGCVTTNDNGGGYILKDEYMVAGDFEPSLVWMSLCDYNYIHNNYGTMDFVPMEAIKKKAISYPTNFKTDTFILTCGSYKYNTETRFGYYTGNAGSVTDYSSNRGSEINALYTSGQDQDLGKLTLNLGIVTLPTTYSAVYLELILSTNNNFSDSSSWKYNQTLNHNNQGEVNNISNFTGWTQRKVTPPTGTNITDPLVVSIGRVLTQLAGYSVPANTVFVQAKYHGTPKT